MSSSRPLNASDPAVQAAMARDHYPAWWRLPTHCQTCGGNYPCEPPPAEEPIDLHTRWIIALPILGLLAVGLILMIMSVW